ncbi:hypothetical protein [Polaromonas sp. CG9_12]|nr:hypothetical protein [Polaromonas sp. CG9_12]
MASLFKQGPWNRFDRVAGAAAPSEDSKLHAVNDRGGINAMP